MSAETVVVVSVIALALAVQSVRVMLKLTNGERVRRAILLIIAAALGVLVVAQLLDWGHWALGVCVGLAVVELGPPIVNGAKTIIKAKANRVAGGNPEHKDADDE